MTKNLVNHKCYVGFHATNKEFDDTYSGSGTLIYQAIKKYKRENFVTGILEYVNENDWREKEIFWIKEMHSHVSEGGYNLTFGGEGLLGFKHSIKTKTKIINSLKGNSYGKGKKRDAIQKKRYSESKSGMNNPFFGCSREKNPRFDFTIYTFINTKTNEIFKGYKFDLAQKLNTNSSSIIRIINGKRKHYKNWICLQ